MLDIDKDVAVRWGEISAAGERVGSTVPVLDGLLAATALTFGLTFVTRNTDHVLETGVRLFDPWETGFPQQVSTRGLQPLRLRRPVRLAYTSAT